MENYLYFAAADINTGGSTAAREGICVPASSYIGADPIGTTSTAFYFNGVEGSDRGVTKVLLTHGSGNNKATIKGVMACVNANPHSGGFVVVADSDVAGASKSSQYSPIFSGDVSTVAITEVESATSGGALLLGGAGAISTDFGGPQVRTKTVNGEIITEVKFSLIGLHCSSTANDVIGLAAGAAYLYQYVAATHGIIHRSELICQTVAAGGGTTDINVVYASSGTLAEDGAGGTTYGVNGGGISTGGIVVQEAAKTAITNAHYAYATVGDTSGDASAFTAGHYIFRTYGYPAFV